MNKNVVRLLSGIVGLVVVAVTILTFFIFGFDKSTANYISLGFLIFSEVVCFLGEFITSKINSITNKMFLRSGTTGVLTIYFIGSLILLFVSGFLKENVSLLVVIEILLVAIVAVVLIAIVISTNKINASEQKTIEDRKLMQICEKRVYDLLVDTKNKPFENDINSVYEMLKYADKIGVTTVDEKIVGAILKLEENLKTSTVNIEQFKEIKSLISMRNMELSETKRGGF